jgi:hypothetical protein
MSVPVPNAVPRTQRVPLETERTVAMVVARWALKALGPRHRDQLLRKEAPHERGSRRPQ